LTPASLYALTALWLASAGISFTLASLIIRGTDSALHGAPFGALCRHVYIYGGLKSVGRVLTVLALGDADGVSSAAVVKAALAGEYEAVRVYFTHPVDLAKDFETFAEGDVYVVDVAIDEKTAAGTRMPKRLLKTLVEELNRLAGGP